MKFAIISDSHNNFNDFYNIVNNNDDIEIFFFLGDGEKELQDIKTIFNNKTFYAVKGNCDESLNYKQVDKVVLENKKIVFTHGDIFNVKDNLDNLIDFSTQNNAHILLYGHTHKSFIGKHNDLYILNPGSITFPRDGKPSYGIINILNNKIKLKLVEI